MYFLCEVSVAHRDIYLIDLLDALGPLRILVLLAVYLSVLDYLFVLLLLFDVITLQLIVNVHVHVVLFHSGELLLHTSANVVLALLDGLHLHQDIVKFTGVL